MFHHCGSVHNLLYGTSLPGWVHCSPLQKLRVIRQPKKISSNLFIYFVIASCRCPRSSTTLKYYHQLILQSTSTVNSFILPFFRCRLVPPSTTDQKPMGFFHLLPLECQVYCRVVVGMCLWCPLNFKRGTIPVLQYQSVHWYWRLFRLRIVHVHVLPVVPCTVPGGALQSCRSKSDGTETKLNEVEARELWGKIG